MILTTGRHGRTKRDIRNLVFAEGFRLIAGGVIAGMIAAIVLSRVLKSFLFNDPNWDYRTVDFDRDVAYADAKLGFMSAVDRNLTLEAAPGHTPGSSVVKLTSGRDRALFAGDLVHTPLQLAHPEHNSCFCEDPAGARRTRAALLGWAADHTALLLPAHFSGNSALEVQRDGGAFALKQWAPFPRY